MSLLQKTETVARIVETACIIYSPKDTGNLSMNAIRSVFEDGMWQVVIGGEVAPYAPYTNEPWISPRWKGKENPNLHWVQDAIESVKPVIIGIFQDKYTQDEIMEYQSYLDSIVTYTTENRERGVIDRVI